MRDKRIPCQVGLSPSLALPLARSIPPTITPFSTPSLAPFLPRGIGARAALRRPASRWLVPPAPEPGGWGVGGAGRRAPRAPGECSGPSTIPMGLACVEVRIVRRATPLPAQRAGHQRRAPSGAALPAPRGSRYRRCAGRFRAASQRERVRRSSALLLIPQPQETTRLGTRAGRRASAA